jgi:hypothetical protein
MISSTCPPTPAASGVAAALLLFVVLQPQSIAVSSMTISIEILVFI